MPRKKKKGGGEAGPETAGGLRWLITYADMITLLLGVFILLASSSQTSGKAQEDVIEAFQKIFSIVDKKGSESGILESPKLPHHRETKVTSIASKPRENQLKALVKGFANESPQRRPVIERSDRGTIIRFRDVIFFDPGNAELKKEAYPTLERLAKILEQIPNNIIIEGHTDPRPIETTQFPSNWDLSVMRAAAVARYLRYHAEKITKMNSEELHKYQARLSITGYGPYKLLDPVNPYAAVNRRIDIVLLKEKE